MRILEGQVAREAVGGVVADIAGDGGKAVGVTGGAVLV